MKKSFVHRIVEGFFSYLPGANYFAGGEYYPDENYGSEWIPISSASTAKQIENILYDNLDRIRLISRQLFHDNDHYRGIIRTYVKYIAGKTPVIESENESANSAWDNLLIAGHRFQFRRFMREWVRRFFRDGETFLYLPTLSFIDPALIVSPSNENDRTLYGIEWDEAGYEKTFYVLDENTNTIAPYDAKLILHTDDTDDDQRRGLPPLLSMTKRVADYDDLLEARIKLNQVRASVALIRSHEGATPTTVKTFADAKKDTSVYDATYAKDRRITRIRPGAVIDTTTRTKYEYLAPNVNATDVKDDIRAVRLCFSALTGLPEFMITGDASNGNYASTMVAEGPGEREIEDWQNFFAEELQSVWRYVTGTEDDPEVRFQQVISRRTKEETDRNKVLLEANVISLAEWRRREGVDGDIMDEEIAGEDELYSNDVAPDAPEMPDADEPKNQDEPENPEALGQRK